MTKEKIFHLLMQGDPETIATGADSLRKKVTHEVIKTPRQELVMFQVEESVEKIDFNVGEILVTSAEVRVEDTMGYAMIMGTNENKALDCALLMAVFEAEHPEKLEVEELAGVLEQIMLKDLREKREIISSTRVNFEVMGGQDPNVKHNT